MPKRKITQEQAGEIRQLYSSGTITQTKLAEMYGISRQIISNIVNNKSYAKKEKGLKTFELRVEDMKKYVYSDNTNNVPFSQFSFDERTMRLCNYYTYPPRQQKDLVKSDSFRKKKKYRLNKDKARESRRRYYEKNKDKLREYHNQYYEQNKDKFQEARKRYYNKNKDEFRERNKQYYEQNKDKFREHNKRYYEQNKNVKSKTISKEKQFASKHEYYKQYYERNKDKINEQRKQKRIEQGQKTPKRVSYKQQLMELLKEQGKI